MESKLGLTPKMQMLLSSIDRRPNVFLYQFILPRKMICWVYPAIDPILERRRLRQRELESLVNATPREWRYEPPCSVSLLCWASASDDTSSRPQRNTGVNSPAMVTRHQQLKGSRATITKTACQVPKQHPRAGQEAGCQGGPRAGVRLFPGPRAGPVGP